MDVNSVNFWKLRVMVKAVRHLPKMDAVGTCDAYALLSMGDFQKHKTKVVPNSYDATWREEFEFYVVIHDSQGEEEHDTISEDNVLTIDIMDHDRYTEPDYVGSVIVNVRDLWEGCSSTDKVLEKHFPVRNMRDPSTPEVHGHDMKTTTVTLVFTHLGISKHATAVIEPAAASNFEALYGAQPALMPSASAPVDNQGQLPAIAANYDEFFGGHAACSTADVIPSKPNNSPAISATGFDTSAIPRIESIGPTEVSTVFQKPLDLEQHLSHPPAFSETAIANGHLSANGAGNVTLHVLVKGAQHLPKKDVAGTCDAYAVLSLGTQKVQTKVATNTYDALWEEKFEFCLSQAFENEVLTIDLLDFDRFTEHDYIGSIIISVSNLMGSGGDLNKELALPLRNLRDPATPEVIGHDNSHATVTLITSISNSPLSVLPPVTGQAAVADSLSQFALGGKPAQSDLAATAFGGGIGDSTSMATACFITSGADAGNAAAEIAEGTAASAGQAGDVGGFCAAAADTAGFGDGGFGGEGFGASGFGNSGFGDSGFGRAGSTNASGFGGDSFADSGLGEGGSMGVAGFGADGISSGFGGTVGFGEAGPGNVPAGDGESLVKAEANAMGGEGGRDGHTGGAVSEVSGNGGGSQREGLVEQAGAAGRPAGGSVDAEKALGRELAAGRSGAGDGEDDEWGAADEGGGRAKLTIKIKSKEEIEADAKVCCFCSGKD